MDARAAAPSDALAGGTIAGVSAIVLAGGRSARFGADKLVADLDGRPLLDHAVLAAAAVCRDVVVVGPPPGVRPHPDPSPGRSGAAGVNVRVVSDVEPFGGPLAGLVTGLETVAEPLALVVGGDMPLLVPAILGLLARELASEGASEAVVLERRGRAEPLPSCIRVGAALPLARRLLDRGEGSLRALLRGLRTRALAEGEWRPLDPAGESLRDVDLPADLERLRARDAGRGA